MILNVFSPYKDQLSWIEYDYSKGNEIKSGDPAVEILRYIKSHMVELLINGTTGKTRVKLLLMGGFTEKVIRELPCSFITTRAKNITDNYFESNLITLESPMKTADNLFENKKI